MFVTPLTIRVPELDPKKVIGKDGVKDKEHERKKLEARGDWENCVQSDVTLVILLK